MTGEEELCRRGWHVVEAGDDRAFVRYGARMTDQNGTFIYRVGARPDDRACTTIWCYGDRDRPWRCVCCGRPIDASTAYYPLSDLAKRHHAEERATGRHLSRGGWRRR